MYWPSQSPGGMQKFEFLGSPLRVVYSVGGGGESAMLTSVHVDHGDDLGTALREPLICTIAIIYPTENICFHLKFLRVFLINLECHEHLYHDLMNLIGKVKKLDIF